MKKILIPTDFCPSVIQLIEKIDTAYNGDFEFLFTHLFYLPDDIQDLLFSTYRMNEYKFVTPEFRDAYLNCPKIKTAVEKKMPVKFFYGNTMIFFKNFLHANEINLIAYSEKNPVKQLHSSSIDVTRIIKKCGVELLNVDNL